MKKPLQLLFALAFLAAGCASPMLKKEAHWEKASGPAAEQARLGKYSQGLPRMMEVAHYLFDTEGFLFTRIDEDTHTFSTDPFKLDGSDVPNIIELVLTKEENGCSAAWKHYQVIKYVNVDACKDNADCQKEFSDDWNWRLFKHLQ